MNRVDASLGVLFFGSLLGLTVLVLVLIDLDVVSRRSDVVMFSDDVGYLRPGDPVMLNGLTSGTVRAVERLAEPMTLPRPGVSPDSANSTVRCTVRIRAKMDIDPYDALHPDFRLTIEETGLLGGKLIWFDVGIEAGLAAGMRVIAVATTHPIESLGDAHLAVASLEAVDATTVKGLVAS